MADAKKGLDEIRREIDRIDQAMHKLLMERGDLISDLQVAKGVTGERGSSAMRPAREARMMRALAARHAAPFPLLAVERIWREIISAFTQLQAGFSVHAAGAAPEILAEMGRFYFGVTTPLTLQSSIQKVITKAETDVNAVALIAAPISEWWMDLASLHPRHARIVARMPFHDHRGGAPVWHHEGWIVSQAPFEPSDYDRSVAVLRSAESIDAQGVENALRASAPEFGNWRMIDQTKESGKFFTLIDIQGYHDADKIPIDGSMEIRFLGGYGIANGSQQQNGEDDD
ncbi:MAG: chorismate mutase [Fimbriimonadaceae bacterium]|nr:chorismate mutase [Alphaproteobacteria bacterium]